MAFWTGQLILVVCALSLRWLIEMKLNIAHFGINVIVAIYGVRLEVRAQAQACVYMYVCIYSDKLL